MTQNAKTASVCPKCGRSLPVDAPRGLCSKCLFSAMLGGPLVAPPISPDAKTTFPREFGSYTLLEEVARGGMGIVYKARQTQIDRVVALKIMAGGQFAEPDFVKRFRTEAEAVAKLDHPNIVPIYEIGESEGQPFFSMRLVEGGSLSTRVADTKSPIPEATAAEILIALARAVHYAHQRGILHRDIKPGNVLLDAQGKPYLTDFGLAKLVEKDSTLTRTMAMLGTPSYMSPEQARGEAKQLTVAVDVYGLGAILYELLTGQPPFGAGTTMKTVRQVLEQEPRRPSTLKPAVNRDLETICLKCLEKDPAQRYGSAEALANDLERWTRHEPILARPTTPLERVVKWVRRHPGGAAFSVTLFVVIATSVIMLARANVHIRTAQKQEIILRHEAEQKTEEIRQQLVRLNVNNGNRLVDEGDSFKALLSFIEALRLEKGDAAREDIQRRRIGAVLRQSPALSRVWFHDQFVRTAEFSPGGDKVVSTTADGKVQIWDVKAAASLLKLRHDTAFGWARFTIGGNRVLTIDAKQQLQYWDATSGYPIGTTKPSTAYPDQATVGLSPDGRWLAAPTASGVQLFDGDSDAPGPLLATTNAFAARFGFDGNHLGVMRDQELDVWKFSSGNWSSLRLPHSERLRGFTFTPDGKTVATFTARDVFIWETENGRPTRSPITLPGNLFDCRFSPNGKWFATACWDGVARIFDARDMSLVTESIKHRTGVARCTFSADGGKLATASWDNSARVWDPGRGLALTPALPHGGYVSAANFSPDGTRLVTAGQDQTVRLWHLLTNSGARLMLRHEQRTATVQFSPEGKRLLTCGYDGRANIWDVHTGYLLVALPRLSQGISHGCFSPDGKRVATAGVDGGARLYDAATGAQIGAIMQHTQRLTYVSFSSDGQRVLTAGGKSRTARLWDAKTGAPVGAAMKHAGDVASAEFSTDGRRVVTACTDETQLPRAAQMWDANTGAPIGPEMAHLDGVTCVQFSPNGQFVATGGEDRIAAIWNASTGARITPSMRHPSFVNILRFSPDSRLLLTLSSVGFDGATARIWETATGEAVTTPIQFPTMLTGCTWSPDGCEIAVGAADGTVYVLDVSPISDAVEKLQSEAEVLAASRLDSLHGLVPLNAQEIHDRWEALKVSPSR